MKHRNLDKNASEKLLGLPISNNEYNERLKQDLEFEQKSILVDYDFIKNKLPDLSKWLLPIFRYNNMDKNSLIFYDNECHFKVKFFTNDNEYTIYGHSNNLKEGDQNGYLGAGYSSRKPRPGENWRRGNDLPDGDYNKKTFDKIIYSILSNEIKSLQLWRED